MSERELHGRRVDLDGAIDMHVHFGPEPFVSRLSQATFSVDPAAAARDAAAAGMGHGIAEKRGGDEQHDRADQHLTDVAATDHARLKYRVSKLRSRPSRARARHPDSRARAVYNPRECR